MKGNKLVVTSDMKNNYKHNNNQKYSKLFSLNYFIEFPKLKFCFIYLLILLIILSLFIVNYFYTINDFEKNNYVNLNPENICIKNIKIFTDCLKKNVKYDKCVYENKAVEDCYDETSSMNRLCYIYLSEVDLCLNNNHYNFEKDSQQVNKTLKSICGTQMEEVIQCSKIYKYIKLDKDKLLENLKK